MEQVQEEKHIIWSNLNLDLKDWREFLEEEYPGRTEDEYYCVFAIVVASLFLFDYTSNP